MHIKSGYQRIVLLIGNVAIKFPNILRGERAIICGLISNIHEYEVWQACINATNGAGDPQLARVYFRSPFGIVLIMKRYRTPLNRPPTNDEKDTLPLSSIDPNPENYAINPNGDIVVLDYGHCDCWYLGRQRSDMLPKGDIAE